jgi:hypothetical protein
MSTLVTLSTTQIRLYFTSSIARAPYHWSSTCHRRPMPIVPPHNDTHGDELADPLSLSRIAYRHVNLRKKIF